jgi:hypothetical protein
VIPEQLKAFVSGQIDRLQATYPPNRLTSILMVVLAAPLAALGGFLAVWVPKHFPGMPHFTAGQYTAAFVTGAGAVLLAAITFAYRFVDGVQKDEFHVTGLADAAAAREHVERLESMRLESQERVAAIAHAQTAEHALELLGHGTDVPSGTPAEAVGATLPPLGADPMPIPHVPDLGLSEDAGEPGPVGTLQNPEPAPPAPETAPEVPPPDQV